VCEPSTQEEESVKRRSKSNLTRTRRRTATTTKRVIIMLVKGVDSSEGNLSAEQKVSKKNAWVLCKDVHTWRQEGH